MPAARVASTARLSASVEPERRMARECCTRGGSTTATVRSGACSSCIGAGVRASASPAALPTEVNSPVATQAAVATRTAMAAIL